MTEMTEYSPGTFCWVDLATNDPEASKAFYCKLLDCTSIDMPAGDAGTYTMLLRNDKNACALYEMPAEMRDQGVPPHWQSYVSVASADETAKKAAELNGTVIAAPFV